MTRASHPSARRYVKENQRKTYLKKGKAGACRRSSIQCDMPAGKRVVVEFGTSLPGAPVLDVNTVWVQRPGHRTVPFVLLRRPRWRPYAERRIIRRFERLWRECLKPEPLRPLLENIQEAEREKQEMVVELKRSSAVLLAGMGDKARSWERQPEVRMAAMAVSQAAMALADAIDRAGELNARVARLRGKRRHRFGHVGR